jgi:hypothetical protein
VNVAEGIIAVLLSTTGDFLQLFKEAVGLAFETVLMVVLRHFVDLLGQVLDGSLVLDSFARDDEPMDLLGESSEVGEDRQVLLDDGDGFFHGEDLEDFSLLLLYVSSSEFLHDVENPLVSKFTLVIVIVFACAEGSLHLVDFHCTQWSLSEEFHVFHHAHVVDLKCLPVILIRGRDLFVSVVSHLSLIFLGFGKVALLILFLTFLYFKLFSFCIS